MQRNASLLPFPFLASRISFEAEKINSSTSSCSRGLNSKFKYDQELEIILGFKYFEIDGKLSHVTRVYISKVLYR